jgi:NAD(P)-dependent dehydrogenase (short-subunit alcohol dehydrogenase family)
MTNLQGRVVVVTGGFGILGAAVGSVLASAGAQVALVDLTRDAGGAGLLRLGGVDIADLPAARSTLDTVVQRLGGLDGLVNVAGGFRWQTVADGELENWDLMYRMNVRTAATMSKAAIPHLRARGSGRIVNIGANGAVKAGAGMGAYAASKAGVARLTESLAEELKGTGINVNAVLPSIIDTPANRKDMPDADFSKWVSPQDLAAVIAFLLSDAAKAVTGALIPVTHLV